MLKRYELANGIIAYEMALGKEPSLRAWSYRIGKTLIDTGPPKMRKTFLPILLNDGPINTIYVTHHHEDHSGLAADIRSQTGAKIVLSRYCAPLTQKGFRQYPYHYLYWGKFKPFKEDKQINIPPLGKQTWQTEDGEFQLIHAPGHSHDLSVVYDAERKALFAADLYLGPKLKVMRRDEHWHHLEASLKRILENCDFDLLLCGHRPAFQNGKSLLEKKYNWMHSSRAKFEALCLEGRSRNEATKEVFGSAFNSFTFISLGNVSQKNMLLSLQKHYKARPDVARQGGQKWANYDFSE